MQCSGKRSTGFMFTGDHILFDISPNITSWLGVEDSLGDYLDSLKKAKKYPVVLHSPGTERREIMRRGLNSFCFIMKNGWRRSIKLLEEKPDMTLYELTGKMRWKIRAASWEDFRRPRSGCGRGMHGSCGSSAEAWEGQPLF